MIKIPYEIKLGKGEWRVFKKKVVLEQGFLRKTGNLPRLCRLPSTQGIFVNKGTKARRHWVSVSSRFMV